MIGWCSKYVHVIADTLIVMSAFRALDKRNFGPDNTSSANSGNGTSGGSACGGSQSCSTASATTFGARRITSSGGGSALSMSSLSVSGGSKASVGSFTTALPRPPALGRVGSEPQRLMSSSGSGRGKNSDHTSAIIANYNATVHANTSSASSGAKKTTGGIVDVKGRRDTPMRPPHSGRRRVRRQQREGHEGDPERGKQQSGDAGQGEGNGGVDDGGDLQ